MVWGWCMDPGYLNTPVTGGAYVTQGGRTTTGVEDGRVRCRRPSPTDSLPPRNLGSILVDWSDRSPDVQ